MRMRKTRPSSSRSFREATSAAAPPPLLVLLALLSLSSARAVAFRSGVAPPLLRHRQRDASRASLVGVDGSSYMRSSPSASAQASPASVASLSRLFFLRGGDDGSETASMTDADDAKVPYGTAGEDPPAPGASADDAADVEMEMESTDGVGPAEASSAASRPSPLALSALAPATSLLKTAAAFYTRQLVARPVLTKSLTAGAIFGLSDWCAQLIELGGESSDAEAEEGGGGGVALSRILTTFLVGLLFFGPAAHAWYGMVFKVLPSNSLLSTLQKAALGQIFFGPAFTCVFFGAGMVQAGTFGLGAWMEKIRADLPGVWASGLGYWPLVDFISFKVVPMEWIPLFVNFCSFVWTIYLSLVANRGKGAEE